MKFRYNRFSSLLFALSPARESYGPSTKLRSEPSGRADVISQHLKSIIRSEVADCDVAEFTRVAVSESLSNYSRAWRLYNQLAIFRILALRPFVRDMLRPPRYVSSSRITELSDDISRSERGTPFFTPLAQLRAGIFDDLACKLEKRPR